MKDPSARQTTHRICCAEGSLRSEESQNSRIRFTISIAEQAPS